MKTVKTNIYKKKHPNGRISWMVRWWDEYEEKWRTKKGGERKDEALVAEAQVREALYHATHDQKQGAEIPEAPAPASLTSCFETQIRG